jgi:hypothetical protein
MYHFEILSSILNILTHLYVTSHVQKEIDEDFYNSILSY